MATQDDRQPLAVLLNHSQSLGARCGNDPRINCGWNDHHQEAPVSGRATDAVVEDLADFDGWKAYVAGPPPMVDAAMDVVFARGLRPEDMHADVFFTPEEQVAAATVE